MKDERYTIPSSSPGPQLRRVEGRGKEGKGEPEEGLLLSGWGQEARTLSHTLRALGHWAPQEGKFCPAPPPWKTGETAVIRFKGKIEALEKGSLNTRYWPSDVCCDLET